MSELTIFHILTLAAIVIALIIVVDYLEAKYGYPSEKEIDEEVKKIKDEREKYNDRF
jgi:hypothetical protein